MNSLEQEFQEEAKHLGYVVYRRGWPDFLIVRGKTVQGVEVKGPNDYVTNAQSAMMNALANVGIHCWVYRGEWKHPDIVKMMVQEENIISQIVRNYEWKLRKVRLEIESVRKEVLRLFDSWSYAFQRSRTRHHTAQLFDTMIEIVEAPPSEGTFRLIQKWERIKYAKS